MDYFKFQFHYEDGQTEKIFSQWKKLCLATQDDGRLWHWEKIFYHIVLWGPGGTKLWNPNIKISMMFLKVSPAILCWETKILAHGENSPFCQASLWQWNLNYNVFFLIFCVPNVKKNYSYFNKKFQFFSEIIFYGLRTFLLIYAHIKMLTLNFDSRFLRIITMANFHQILKVRIVSKSELSWLSKNVQNCNPRYPRSWEIAYF